MDAVRFVCLCMCHHFSFEIRSSKIPLRLFDLCFIAIFVLLLFVFLCSCFVQPYYCFTASNIRLTDKHDEQRRQRILWFQAVSTQQASNNMRHWDHACALCAQRVSKIYDNFIILLRFLNVIVSRILLLELSNRLNSPIHCFAERKKNERSKMWSAHCQLALGLNSDTAPSHTSNGC